MEDRIVSIIKDLHDLITKHYKDIDRLTIELDNTATEITLYISLKEEIVKDVITDKDYDPYTSTETIKGA